MNVYETMRHYRGTFLDVIEKGFKTGKSTKEVQNNMISNTIREI